jgi:hypothetical protein
MSAETGTVCDLSQDEPRAVALTVKEWKTHQTLVPSLLLLTLAPIETMYAAIGAACKRAVVRLILQNGVAVPRDPDVQVRALLLRHHDVVFCTLGPQGAVQPTSTGARGRVRCARCDRPVAPLCRFHLQGYALDVCNACVPFCAPALRRRLQPVNSDAFVRDGVFSTLRPDLIWTPHACNAPSAVRAWLLSRYGPYTDAPHLMDRDVQYGAGTLPHVHALVWLWPP